MRELNKERIIWIDYAKAIAMFFCVSASKQGVVQFFYLIDIL